VSARGGGLGQSASEGRRHLGDVGGDVVGLASASRRGARAGWVDGQRSLGGKS
jgi:hypothetical protein